MSMPAWDGREHGREPGSLLGGLLDVRRARPRDRRALALMLDRCGSETRYRRFHGYVSAFPERYLAEALSGRPAHFALVAEAAGGGTLVALASCRTVAAGVAELGILVEDAWQRLGIGGRLLAEIVNHAERARLTALRAQLLADQAWIAGMLRRYGPCAAVASREVLDVTLRLGS
jgi:GNAT superfamily N-acetyltransferase